MAKKRSLSSVSENSMEQTVPVIPLKDLEVTSIEKLFILSERIGKDMTDISNRINRELSGIKTSIEILQEYKLLAKKILEDL